MAVARVPALNGPSNGRQFSLRRCDVSALTQRAPDACRKRAYSQRATGSSELNGLLRSKPAREAGARPLCGGPSGVGAARLHCALISRLVLR